MVYNRFHKSSSTSDEMWQRLFFLFFVAVFLGVGGSHLPMFASPTSPPPYRFQQVFDRLTSVDLAETGVITRRLLTTLSELTETRPGLLILGDSRRGVGDWPNLTFKMNVNELAAMTGNPRPLTPAEVGAMAVEVARRTRRSVFITMAEKGMLAATPEGEVERVASLPLRGNIDVVGAGDSVTANLTVALAAGATLREALQIASAAASLVIHQLGTTGVATVEQMEELLFGSMLLA